MGNGLNGFVVSQLTSTTTDSFLRVPASTSCSRVKKGGMVEERYMQLTKMSTSSISLNGPPLAVSAMSHFKISSLNTRSQFLMAGDGTLHLLVQTDFTEQINRSASTSPQGTNDKSPDAFSAAPEGSLDILDHRNLVRIWIQTAQLVPLSLGG